MSIQFCVGPTKDSINDFWRMIWQVDIGKIVMLTNLLEEDKVFMLNLHCIHYISKLDGAFKKGKRKVQGVPQSQTEALPRPQEEEETDKSKQAQTEQTYEKH